ncbi:MAG TPA: SpoIIE family protein phosphatase [Spirochaetota bacterium]
MNNTIFLFEAFIALFMGVYMLINYRKYRQTGFNYLLVIFGIVFVKAMICFFSGFANIDLLIKVSEDGAKTFYVPNPDQVPLYNFKLFVWQYFETLVVIAYAYYFIPRIRIAEYQEDVARIYERIFLGFAGALSAFFLFVVVTSFIGGSASGFRSEYAAVEFIKKTLSTNLFTVIRIGFLWLVIKEIMAVNESHEINLRIISKFKNVILWFLGIDIGFSVICWFVTPYLHPNIFVIRMVSLLLIAWYGYGLLDDMVSSINDRLDNLTREHSLFVTLINKMSSSLGSEKFDVGDVLTEILNSAVRASGGRSGALFLSEMDGNKKVVRARYIRGIFPTKKPLVLQGGVAPSEMVIQDKVLRETIAFGEGLIGEVAQSGKSIFITDTKKDPRYEQTIKDIIYVTSFIAVPLVSQNEVFGVLAVISDNKQFQPENYTLLEILGNFDSMAHTMNEYSQHMTELVNKKTAEVEELLEQQHGDYYLTSLLVKPLLVNQAQNTKIKVDFYVDQKKKFKFRKWNAEIGGDICIAYSITLKGRSYTVFANADAMGKSMQGAGGALVFGVVFISYVMRTLTIPSEQERSAREWLAQAYRELQTIFETFDGSMLISAVIGIIEDDSGKMFHFNCEHPWVVLYRGGKAAFIESEEKMGRKIGTIGFAEMLIQENHLIGGDILILGSDGRDDIKLGVDDVSGQRIINEDEKLFLTKVEEGQGNLSAIAEGINQIGELTDDLSLARIYIAGSSDTTVESSDKDEDESLIVKTGLNEAMRCYKNGEYEKGKSLLSSMIPQALPGNESYRIYHLMGNISYKLGNLEEALEFWQNALENNPSNEQLVKNIDLLEKKLGPKKRKDLPADSSDPENDIS